MEDEFTEGALGTFTVNGESSGRVEGGGGRMQASIRFYFAANPNQMPVRYVRIDPGDGSNGYPAGAGSYPNHRGKVKVGSTFEEICKDNAEAYHFGVSDDACVKKDFRFRTNYNCPSGSENTLPPCTNGADPSTTGFESALNDEGCWDPTAHACIFRPRVQVQDNWGYCTNDPGDLDDPNDDKQCGGASGPGGTKCYDDSTNPECDTPNAWVPFAGRIVVTPP